MDTSEDTSVSRKRPVVCFLGISESAVEMGCAAGCANSNVHEPDEPELKGSKGHITMAPMGPMGLMGPKGPKGPRPKTSGVQQHKMHHIKHKQQRKADLVELESKTSKSMMAEDPPFRSMFEGVGGPGPVLYQPYLGFGFGYNSLTFSG